MNTNGIQLYEALNPCLHIGDASDSLVIFFSQKKYFRDFCSAWQSSSKLDFTLAFRKNPTLPAAGRRFSEIIK